jgi:putative Mn2+ efflux pump MntP
LNNFEILVLAFGLSMDGFAVSIANGIIYPKLKFKNALIVAFIMGFFHFAMPIIGYYFSVIFESYLKVWDHWIALILLNYIGGKMIYESFQNKEQKKIDRNEIGITFLLLQALATSIDALVIGISLGFLKIAIYKASFIIGFVTFLMVMIGLKAGLLIGNRLGKKMELIGGLLLVFIGLRIFLSHLL